MSKILMRQVSLILTLASNAYLAMLSHFSCLRDLQDSIKIAFTLYKKSTTTVHYLHEPPSQITLKEWENYEWKL